LLASVMSLGGCGELLGVDFDDATMGGDDGTARAPGADDAPGRDVASGRDGSGGSSSGTAQGHRDAGDNADPQRPDAATSPEAGGGGGGGGGETDGGPDGGGVPGDGGSNNPGPDAAVGRDAATQTGEPDAGTDPNGPTNTVLPRFAPSLCDREVRTSIRITSSRDAINTGESVCDDVVQQRGGPPLCVLRGQTITVDQGASFRAVGFRVLALVATGDIDVRGFIDASARGTSMAAGATDPGHPGAAANASTGGGGGGGGSTHAGGAGGGNASGGPRWTLDLLRGGAVGGASGSPQSGEAGRGGGAVYLVSCKGSITIAASGGIDASGSGGSPGRGAQRVGTNFLPPGNGGGGGGGGAIVLEANTLRIAGTLVANGGGGGGGGAALDGEGRAADGVIGADGARAEAAALGGAGGANVSRPGGSGGAGGARQVGPAQGLPGANGGGSGGGGGAAGYVVLRSARTTTPNLSGAVVSPAPLVEAVLTQ
jgi:hypothetical protein